MDKLKLAGLIVAGLVTGIVVGRVLPADAADTEIGWKFGNNQLKMNVKKDLTSPEVMFNKLFSTEFSSAGALALLRKRHVFSTSETALVEDLAQLCPAAGLDGEDIEQRQARLSKCLEGNIALTELRRRSSMQLPPFHPIGESIRVGIPENQSERPQRGFANACRFGPFYKNSVQVINPRNGRVITVRVSQSYLCSDPAYFPGLQLSKEDALDLFGGGIAKTENAVAIVIGS